MADDGLKNLRAVIDRLAPTVNGLRWTLALTPAMRACGIVTPKRAAAFMGQVLTETGALVQLSENLTYSPSRLCQVWPDRFPDLASAIPYANNGPKLANLVYGGRMGNGPPESGDGWRFRGGGCLQLTGRDLTEQCAAAFHRSPEDMATWLITPEGAASSGVWYWTQKKLNALADAWDIQGITRRINGGLTDYASRYRYSLMALKILDPTSLPAPAPAAAPSEPSTADQLMAQELATLSGGTKA